MTIQEVMEIVEDETGERVTPETKLDSLGMDSLDFLALMTRLDIPDVAVPQVETVLDLYMMRTPAIQ